MNPDCGSAPKAREIPESCAVLQDRLEATKNLMVELSKRLEPARNALSKDEGKDCKAMNTKCPIAIDIDNCTDIANDIYGILRDILDTLQI